MTNTLRSGNNAAKTDCRLHATGEAISHQLVGMSCKDAVSYHEMYLSGSESCKSFLLDSSPENHRQEESNNLKAPGGKQVDDLLDGFIGAVVGGFEFAGRLVSDVGAGMEAAVGGGGAEP